VFWCTVVYGVLYGGVWSAVVYGGVWSVVRWCMECCTVVYGVCWCTVVYAVWLLLNISSGKVPERKPKTHNDRLDVLTERGWRKCDAIDALKDTMSNGEEDIEAAQEYLEHHFTISFSIDDQFVVRNITSPGSFRVSRPLVVGDTFLTLDGVFLTSKGDDISRFIREKSFPTMYKVELLRQSTQSANERYKFIVQISQITEFVPDSSWRICSIHSSSDSPVSESEPGQGVFVCGGVQWCMVECVCISCAK
jgi:hypothetical protein